MESEVRDIIKTDIFRVICFIIVSDGCKNRNVFEAHVCRSVKSEVNEFK